MDDTCSVAYPMTVGNASLAARDASRSLLRWVVLGAASIALFALALVHSASVGAAAPCVPINYTTCVTPGTSYVAPTYVAPTYVTPTYVTPAIATTGTTTGYPANTVVSTYYDPRYGVVSVVTDGSGNLIDVNAATGQRIYPVFPDYGYGAGYVAGNFIGNPAFINGNGLFNGNYAFNGFNYLNGNVNTFPAGGTAVGGVVYYNDNRFCGDGKVAFVPGQGYFCQNGSTLVPNGTTTVNCNNFFGTNGCGIYRPFEVSSPVTAPAQTATQVTTYEATAPKAAVVAPAAVIAPQVPVIAPAAPPSVTIAPAATTVDRTDHSG